MNEQMVQESVIPASGRQTVLLARVLTLLLPAIVGLYGLYQGVQQVLWPAQVAAVAPDDKVQIVALGGLMSGIAGTIALPVGAAISDRTHSRWGRRTPWLLATSLVVLVSCAGLGLTSSVPLMLFFFALQGLFANWYQGVIYAVIPDRVPQSHRGVASTVVGLGLPLGILIFVNLVARMSQVAGYLLVGNFLVVSTMVFVLAAKEGPATPAVPIRSQESSEQAASAVRSRRSGPAEALSFFAAFCSWDFSMAFFSRLVVFFGFFTMSALNFYIMSDFIGAESLPKGNVAAAVATLATVSTGCQVIAVLIFGKLADILDRRKLIVGLAALGLAIAFAVPMVSPTWTGMIIYHVIAGACMGVYFAVDVAVMSLVLPDAQHAGRDLGVLAIATSVPAMLAGLVGSLLLSATGTYASVFVFGMVCSVLGGIGTLLIRAVR